MFREETVVLFNLFINYFLHFKHDLCNFFDLRSWAFGILVDLLQVVL